MVSDVFIAASSLLLLPLYTHYISPEDYGNIYLVQTITSLFTILFSLLLHSSISRYYFECETPHDVKLMYSTIIRYGALVSISFFCICIVFKDYLFFFIDIPFYPYVFIALLNSVFSTFYLYIESLLRIQEKAKILSAITIFTSLSTILFTLTLVIMIDDKILAYIIALCIGAIFRFLTFIVFTINNYTPEKDNNIKQYLVYGIKYLPTDLSAWVVTFFDRIMLYEMKGELENGIYSTGYKIGQSIEIVFHAINRAYVPYVYSRYKNMTEQNENELNEVSTLMLSMYSTITLIGIYFAKEFVYLLDDRYSDSHIVIIIIMVTYMFGGAKLIYHGPMSFKVEYLKYKALIWIISGTSNVLLNLMLIPKYSYIGAAGATFISYAINLIMTIYYSNKAIHVNYNKRIIILISSIFTVFLSPVIMAVSVSTIIIKIALIGMYIYIQVKIIGVDVILKHINYGASHGKSDVRQ